MSRTNVLNTTTVNYLELIGNGKSYRVPPYQRDYAWTEEEWEDLWNDVLDLRERPDARHYMGALVVKGDSDREFTIIDGQQRLATIGALSLAVIDKLQRIADRDIDRERNRERATELRNRFIGEKDPASLIESSRLNLSRADDAFYQDYLVQLRSPPNPRGLTRSNALLWKCFQYFSEQLDALNDVQENGEALARILSESVARRLLFILITVEDDLNAYTVFETLNARGLELTTADLLKNYLFSKVRVQADLDALQRRWHALIATVTPERFSEFLRYHLLCEQPRIRKERLFKLIRDRIGTPPQVFDLLEALENRAELYAALADANHEYWQDRPEARPHVRDLILFRARQVTPMLFAAWERFSPDDFDRVLKLAGVVSFRYLVSGRNPNALEPAYHEAAKAILGGNANRPRAVFAHLRPVYVDDGAFASNFAVYSINPRGRKKLLKYILCRLEDDANSVERENGCRDGARIHRAHSPAESIRRLVGCVHRGGGAGGSRTHRQRDPPGAGSQPRYRKRVVCRQASCVRTKHLHPEPAGRGDGTRGMAVCVRERSVNGIWLSGPFMYGGRILCDANLGDPLIITTTYVSEDRDRR